MKKRYLWIELIQNVSSPQMSPHHLVYEWDWGKENDEKELCTLEFLDKEAKTWLIMSLLPSINSSHLDVFTTAGKNIVLNILNGTNSHGIDAPVNILTREQLKKVEYFSFLMYLISFLIGAPANLYVLIGMIRNTLKIKQEVRLLLIHLAIADMTVMWILVPTELVWKLTGEWLADDFTCKFLSFFRTFGLYGSSFILIAISLDRYFAIKNPLENIDSEKRIKLMLSVSWFLATILSIPQVRKHFLLSNYYLHFIDTEVEPHPIQIHFHLIHALDFNRKDGLLSLQLHPVAAVANRIIQWRNVVKDSILPLSLYIEFFRGTGPLLTVQSAPLTIRKLRLKKEREKVKLNREGKGLDSVSNLNLLLADRFTILFQLTQSMF